MKPVKRLVLFAPLFLSATSAWALPQYNAQNFSQMTQGAVNTVVDTIAIGADHRPLRSARPLGLAMGFDLGVEASAIELTKEFKSAMSLAASNAVVPAYLPVPKFLLHKGLPFRIDFGMSYIGYQGNRIIGGDLQWSIFHRDLNKLLVAVRTSYTHAKVFFLTSRTYKADLLISKKMVMIEPYGGFGVQTGSGEVNAPINTSFALPVNVTGSHSFTYMHLYAGLPIDLFFFHLTLEHDYSFAKFSTTSAKVSFEF